MRDVGPAFKVFANAELGLEGQNDTKPYIGIARLQLGVLKNRMAQGGLAQGQRTVDMPDGTRIIVRSMHGIDKFAIIAPSEVPALPEEKDYPIPQTPSEEFSIEPPTLDVGGNVYAVCGTYMLGELGDRSIGLSGSYNTRAFAWAPGRTARDLGLLPGAIRARAYAISGDGKVIVGACVYEDSNERAFRWTSGDGMVDLGLLSTRPGGAMAATGVSYDGHVVAGYGPGPGNPSASGVCWVWDANNGMQVLPGSSVALDYASGQISQPRVSPNGKFISGFGVALGGDMIVGYSTLDHGGGNIVTSPFYAKIRGGAVWQRSSSGSLTTNILAAPGTYANYFYNYSSFHISRRWQQPYYVVPTDVADNGDVCGNAPYAVMVPFGGAAVFITPPGSAGNPATVAYGGEVTTSAGPSGEQSSAVAITREGVRVAGNHATTAFQVEPHFFAWSRAAGVQDGPVGTVYAMSRDGTRYAGAVSRTAVTGGWQPFPMYWTRASAQEIALPSEAAFGYATGVASTPLPEASI